MSYRITRTFPPIVAVLILGVVVWGNHLHPQPKDAEPYHQKVRQVASQIPKMMGDWQATDEEVPAAAVALLRPNLIISREYRNLMTGDKAQLLFVQCRDARDMVGHFHPICYPAHGWILDSQESATQLVKETEIPLTKYRFSIKHGQTSAITIWNFLLLPNEKIVPDMKPVTAAGRDYLHHFYGAAQMQLVFDSDVSAEQQQKIFCELVGAHLPLIQTVMAGVGNE